MCILFYNRNARVQDYAVEQASVVEGIAWYFFSSCLYTRNYICVYAHTLVRNLLVLFNSTLPNPFF